MAYKAFSFQLGGAPAARKEAQVPRGQLRAVGRRDLPRAEQRAAASAHVSIPAEPGQV